MNSTTVYFNYVESPIGKLLLTSDGSGLTGLYFEAHRRGPEPGEGWERRDALFSQARAELSEYFDCDRQKFNLKLALHGTPFQQRVWAALRAIPLGTTVTYKALAESIGAAAAVRAVGAAVGRNPVSIIVPCHRVIGSNGSLTGFAGGIGRKRWLLGHEQAAAGNPDVNRLQLTERQPNAVPV